MAVLCPLSYELNMPYSASEIADWFLARADQAGEALTPMKVLKLVYIASGWYLAQTDEKLINDRIEAWQFGPVVPSLYHRFSHFGSAAITEQPRKPVFPQPLEELLSIIWNVYGSVSARDLSALTHLPGTPWTETYNGRRSTAIPPELIRKHYREMAKISL